MKKRFLVAAGATVLTLGMSITTMAADVPTDTAAFFTFNETIDGATPIAKGTGGNVGAATEKTFNYVDGKDGKAVAINDGEEKDNIGIDTNVTVDGADSFTISFWAKAYEAPFAAPVVWVGATSQAPEAWIGYWSGFNNADVVVEDVTHGAGTWAPTAGIGSNDSTGARLGATAPISLAAEFGYDYITMTVDATTHEGVLYYNGKEVARTAEGSALPTLGDGSHIYIGANAWDSPAKMEIDNLAIFKRVLSAEEVQALYDVNGVPKADAEKVEQEETQEATTAEKVTRKPSLTTPGLVSNETTTAAAEEDGSGSTVVIVVVVVVLVVAVVGAVLVATKKKKA